MGTDGEALASTGAGARPRLPYWPALDGLRGLAVAAVLLFHGGVGWARGGFLGVSLFFTLSGFLITSLALAEHATTGTIRPKAFWVRRIRRLLPASLLALVLALIVTPLAIPVAQRADAIGDIRAALFNVANWRFIFQGASYADLDLVPSPVEHYWSLAIEEQFYLVFPLLAVVALRRRASHLAWLLGAVVVGSVAAQVAIEDPNRIYFGTDTRAAELAIGGLLAIALPHVQRLLDRRSTAVADATGAVALAATVVLWVAVEQQAGGLYDGGLAAVAVVSALLIFGAVDGARLRGALAVGPLVALGKISYGVYLFHFPIFLWLSEDRLGATGAPQFAVRCAVTLAVATASYHLLECPIRYGRRVTPRWVVAGTAGAALALAAATVPAAVVLDGDGRSLTDAGVDIVASVPLPDPAPAAAAAPSTSSADGGAEPPGDPDEAPPRIVVVGDSTAAANGAALQAWGLRTRELEVATVTSAGCAVRHGPRFRVRDGYLFTPKRCDALLPAAVDEAQAIDADAIVVFIGSSQLADWELPGLPGWHHMGQATMDHQYVRALDVAAAQLSEAGVPVLWADVPTPRWDLEAFGEMLGGALPGSGPVSLNEPARAARLNELDAEVLPRHDLVARWPYRDLVEAAPAAVRPDGLHVSEEGMSELVDAGLIDRLEAAYRTVVDRSDRTAALSRNTWSLSSPG